jgi:hypothetical protein
MTLKHLTDLKKIEQFKKQQHRVEQSMQVDIFGGYEERFPPRSWLDKRGGFTSDARSLFLPYLLTHGYIPKKRFPFALEVTEGGAAFEIHKVNPLFLVSEKTFYSYADEFNYTFKYDFSNGIMTELQKELNGKRLGGFRFFFWSQYEAKSDQDFNCEDGDSFVPDWDPRYNANFYFSYPFKDKYHGLLFLIKLGSFLNIRVNPSFYDPNPARKITDPSEEQEFREQFSYQVNGYITLGGNSSMVFDLFRFFERFIDAGWPFSQDISAPVYDHQAEMLKKHKLVLLSEKK